MSDRNFSEKNDPRDTLSPEEDFLQSENSPSEENSPQVDVRGNIATWLRDMANKMEENSLDALTEQLLSECYMKCMFASGDDEIDGEATPENMMKFLSLGWYIYSKVIPGSNTSHTTSDKNPSDEDISQDDTPDGEISPEENTS